MIHSAADVLYIVLAVSIALTSLGFLVLIAQFMMLLRKVNGIIYSVRQARLKARAGLLEFLLSVLNLL